MIRGLVAAAGVSLVLASGDCSAGAPEGSASRTPGQAPAANGARQTPAAPGTPAPRKGDPEPPVATGNVVHIIRLRCAWSGRRFMEAVPYIHRELPPIELPYSESGAGVWENTYQVQPGESVGVTCRPDRTTWAGFNSCSVLDFATVVDYHHVQGGPAVCSYRVPRD